MTTKDNTKENTIELTDTYIAATYTRSPAVFTHAEGAFVFDESGKPFINLGTGIAVNTFGQDAGWAKAVSDQAATLAHTSNLYYTQPQAQLAQTLCSRTGMQRVFFSNSGAEANECLLKTARKWFSDQHASNEPPVVITLKNSFHGRTLFTLAATGQDEFHKHFGPFPNGFAYAEPNNIQHVIDLVRANQNRVCAILVELIQGEGGVRVLDKAYIQAIAKICSAEHILFCVDEVQTGNGRTGTLYAWQQFGILPDIFSTAKGLAGGLPLGATFFGEKTADTLNAGAHGSTFGGNPICCAAANYILQKLDEPMLTGVRIRADYIRETLRDCPGVEEISGLGLMIGVQTTQPAGEIVAKCRERGVLVLTAHDRVRLLPPLDIPLEILAQGLGVLREVLQTHD